MTRHRFAVLGALSVYVLISAGGMVTSTGSSLSVPDWPLSYGQWMPPMRGGVLFEHGHRMIAGVVATLIVVSAAWSWKAEPRPWVRRLALWAAAGVLGQALLGGITVLYQLPPAVSIAHACLAQAILALSVCVAQACSPAYLERERLGARGPWRLGAWAAGAAYLQLVLGALYRHTGKGIFLHLAGAVLAFSLIAWAAVRGSEGRDAWTAFPAKVLGAATALQLFLGVGAWTARAHGSLAVGPALLRTAHVACGALILAFCVILGLRSCRSEA